LKEYKEQLFKKKAKSMVNFEKGGGWGRIPWGRDSRRALKAGGAIG
jgi:hypothetical protein